MNAGPSRRKEHLNEQTVETGCSKHNRDIKRNETSFWTSRRGREDKNVESLASTKSRKGALKSRAMPSIISIQLMAFLCSVICINSKVNAGRDQC